MIYRKCANVLAVVCALGFGCNAIPQDSSNSLNQNTKTTVVVNTSIVDYGDLVDKSDALYLEGDKEAALSLLVPYQNIAALNAVSVAEDVSGYFNNLGLLLLELNGNLGESRKF